MSKAERKPSESEADVQKRSSYEETPGRQTGEAKSRNKNASDESTVLEYSFTVSLSGFVPAGD